MRKTLLLLGLIIISCKRNHSENSNIETEKVPSEKSDKQNLRSYCFYKLDDKYSTEKDSVTINRWLKEKSLAILNSDSIYNIFSHEAGGPNGAEWNPNTDLYIAVLTSGNESAEFPEIHINQKPFDNKIYEYNTSLQWYLIEHGFWEQELKTIDTSDLKKMYAAEFSNGLKNGEFSASAALDEGKILEFEIAFKDKK